MLAQKLNLEEKFAGGSRAKHRFEEGRKGPKTVIGRLRAIPHDADQEGASYTKCSDLHFSQRARKVVDEGNTGLARGNKQLSNNISKKGATVDHQMEEKTEYFKSREGTRRAYRQITRKRKA